MTDGPCLPESPLRAAAQDRGSSPWHGWRRSVLWASVTLLLWGAYAQGLSLWMWAAAQGYLGTVAQQGGVPGHGVGGEGFDWLLVPPLALGLLGLHLLAGTDRLSSPRWWLTWALVKVPAVAAALAYAALVVNAAYVASSTASAGARSPDLRPALTLGCVGALTSGLVVALPLSWRRAGRHVRALAAILLSAPAMAYAIELGSGWHRRVPSLPMRSALGAVAWSVVPVVGGVVLAWLAYTQPEVADTADERSGEDA